MAAALDRPAGPGGTARQSSAMSCGRSCAAARSRHEASASIRSPPMSSMESMTSLRSFSAARAASPMPSLSVLRSLSATMRDELSAKPVMQVAHQSRAFPRQRRGAFALLLSREARLQLLLGLAELGHQAAAKPSTRLSALREAPGEPGADRDQQRRIGQPREEDAVVGNEVGDPSTSCSERGQHDGDGRSRTAGSATSGRRHLRPRYDQPRAATDAGRPIGTPKKTKNCAHQAGLAEQSDRGDDHAGHEDQRPSLRGHLRPKNRMTKTPRSRFRAAPRRQHVAFSPGKRAGRAASAGTPASRRAPWRRRARHRPASWRRITHITPSMHGKDRLPGREHDRQCDKQQRPPLS